MPVAYPLNLRTIISTSKSRTQPAAFALAQPRRGYGYVEPTGTDTPLFWDVLFRFTRAEAEQFRLWFVYGLRRGTLEFSMPLHTEFGLQTYTLQFLPDSLLPLRHNGEVFEYSAQVMARAELVPAGTLTAYAGTLSSSIPDQTGAVGAGFTLDTSTYFTGGTGPFTYEVSQGTLPAGATLNPTTGVISFTPGGASTSTDIVVTRRSEIGVPVSSNPFDLTVTSTTGAIIGRFNGTNGQTSGVANDGTIGGTFVFANGAAVSTDARENGLGVPYQAPQTLKFPGVAAATAQADCPSVTLASGVLADAYSDFNLDFRFQFGSVAAERPVIRVEIHSRYFFFDGPTYPTVVATVRSDALQPLAAELTSPDYSLGGASGTLAEYDHRFFGHFRLSIDSARNVRLFVDGVQVGTTGSISNAANVNKSNPKIVVTISAPGWNTSPVYIDSLRLALGEATTSNFTPPGPAI